MSQPNVMCNDDTSRKAEVRLGSRKSVNPFVFIVGSPRSGTTMLRRMIDAHPQLAICRETHWIPRYFEKCRGVTPDGVVLPSLLDELLAYRRFAHLKIDRAALEAILSEHPTVRYADFVAAIFDRFALNKGKPFAGDKTPTYVRKIGTLHSLWPRTKFIHLIRDGRDVCLSMLNWRMNHRAAGRFDTWNEDPVVTTALWWKALVQLGREDGLALGEEVYREYRYESLVENPTPHCKSIAHFLSLPYCGSMVEYHQGRTKVSEGVSANASWLPPTPGLRDWRNDMTSEDVMRFEAASGDLLLELGYERASTTPTDTVRRNVRSVTNAFTKCAMQRKWRLPIAWEKGD